MSTYVEPTENLTEVSNIHYVGTSSLMGILGGGAMALASIAAGDEFTAAAAAIIESIGAIAVGSGVVVFLSAWRPSRRRKQAAYEANLVELKKHIESEYDFTFSGDKYTQKFTLSNLLAGREISGINDGQEVTMIFNKQTGELMEAPAKPTYALKKKRVNSIETSSAQPAIESAEKNAEPVEQATVLPVGLFQA